MVLETPLKCRGARPLGSTHMSAAATNGTTYNAFQSREREPASYGPNLAIGDSLARQLFAFAATELEFEALRRLNDFHASERDVHLAVSVCERHGKFTMASKLLSLLADETVVISRAISDVHARWCDCDDCHDHALCDCGYCDNVRRALASHDDIEVVS